MLRSIAALLLLAGSTPAQEPLVPDEWLVIGPLDSRGRRPFRPDAVFERYLLEPGPVPVAGEGLAGSEGDGVWERVQGGGRIAVGGRGAYAYAALEREAPGVFLAELRGATTLHVGGEGVGGDVYRYGYEGYPVALRAGRNDLFVTGARGGFDLALVPVEEGVRFGARDRTVPDLLVGAESPVGFLLMNAATTPASGLSIEVSAPAFVDAVGACPGTLPPLGVARGFLRLGCDAVPEGIESVPIVVRERTSGATLELTLTVRHAGERHRRTYRSEVDGSVQEYVLNPPAPGGDGPMRLALSLHGAGVGAWGQASSYGPKPDFWVVAATNRRSYGFDWQDWGRRDAYDVLAEAQRVSGVDDRYVYVTGHSMGGHGTWHLAVNDPDRFAACGPSAGWATFDTYGGRPEGSKRELWHHADGASLTFELVDNLRDVPPYVIHGTRDTNVPPDQAHRMIAAMTRANVTFEAHFEGGAGHWWGGRCVDWPPLFEHFRQHERPADPVRIEFVTVDPGVDSRHHWVRVQQPLEYGRSSRVSARDEEGAITVTTENVRRLYVDRPATVLTIDGQELLPVDRGYERGEAGWSAMDPFGRREKAPAVSGPFKRAFDNDFVLVVGTLGDDERDAALLARARHDSTVWTYRGNGNAPVVTDRALLEGVEGRGDTYRGERNVILYGNRDDNAAWARLLGEDPVLDVRDGLVRLGERRLEGDHAAVFVLPAADTGGSLVGVFASTSTRAARVGDTFAPFISGVGYPDYAVVSLDVLRAGDDAVVAAGWFDHAWRLAE